MNADVALRGKPRGMHPQGIQMENRDGHEARDEPQDVVAHVEENDRGGGSYITGTLLSDAIAQRSCEPHPKQAGDVDPPFQGGEIPAAIWFRRIAAASNLDSSVAKRHHRALIQS